MSEPMPSSDQGASRRQGDHYEVSSEEIDRFRRDGYVHLEGVLGAEEIAEVEEMVRRFLDREVEVPDKDFCDMSGDYSKPVTDYSIINVMLPREYDPAWQGNLFERRAASIAAQLQGEGLVIDYDQILAKRPQKDDAVFSWHQDLAYWPVTPDTRTATLWLAVDDSTVENGCMRFVPGSHLEESLRVHAPKGGDRADAHTLVSRIDEDRDEVRLAPISRGDVTVHNERVLHGSGGNTTDGWRRAYVLAFRAEETVQEERRRGFTHSHNDDLEVLGEVGREDDASPR